MYQACSAFENVDPNLVWFCDTFFKSIKLVTYKVTAGSAFENLPLLLSKKVVLYRIRSFYITIIVIFTTATTFHTFSTTA